MKLSIGSKQFWIFGVVSLQPVDGERVTGTYWEVFMVLVWKCHFITSYHTALAVRHVHTHPTTREAGHCDPGCTQVKETKIEQFLVNINENLPHHLSQLQVVKNRRGLSQRVRKQKHNRKEQSCEVTINCFVILKSPCFPWHW